MIINTKIIVKDAKGLPIKTPTGEPFTLGEVLGSIIFDYKAGGKMKCYVLGDKLFKQDKVEVDSADLALLKTACEATETYNNLIAGQVLQILEEIKESDEKPKDEKKKDEATA